MAASKWLILTALDMEAKAVRRALGDNPAVRVEVIGPKAVAMSQNVFQGCDRAILAGLAGGLDPGLKIGDVVCSATDRGKWPTVAGLPVRWGKIHTSATVISTPAEKAQLFQSTGSVAVDMETAIVQTRADEAGVPLLVVRAISDLAGDAVDPKLLNWIDDQGRPKAATIARAAILNPSLLKEAMKLGKQSTRAAVELGRIAAKVVEAGI